MFCVSGVLHNFSAICVHCGDTEIIDPNENEQLSQLKKDWATVRPICPSCLEGGKIPVTRNAIRVANRRT